MDRYIRATDRTTSTEVYQRTTNRHYETQIVHLPAEAEVARERRIQKLQEHYATVCPSRQVTFKTRPGLGVICIETGQHFASQRKAILSLFPDPKRFKSLEVLMSRAIRDGTAFEGYHWKREASDK